MNDHAIAALIEPLSTEDRLLFARAYREYYGALVAFVRRRVDSDAETADLVQEAYARLLRYRERQDLVSLKSILFQIAINLLTDRSRRHRSESRGEHIPWEQDLTLYAADPSPYRHVVGEQDVDRLFAAVEQLPDKCREVFILRRFRGLTQQEIADRLGIGIKMVEKYITTALKLCRQQVGREEA